MDVCRRKPYGFQLANKQISWGTTHGAIVFRYFGPLAPAGVGVLENFFFTQMGNYLQQVAAVAGAVVAPGIRSALAQVAGCLP
jgi:hypothetical protein